MFPLNQNSKLEAFLGSSPASNIQWSVGYIDLPPQTDAATEQQRGNTFPSTSNGTSDVTICPYPGQKSASSSITGGQPAWVRNILYVKGYNPNASAVTATIQINDGSDDVQYSCSIPAGGTVYYEDKQGWYLQDASGGRVTSNTTTNLGTWTTPTFSAGNFTGGGSQAWTVASGDVGTYAYMIIGNTMTVAFSINTSTVGGTPNTDLQIAIPASRVATKAMRNSIQLLDNGTRTTGVAFVSASGTIISIQRTDGANFSAATDATYVLGEITFEINP